MLLKASYTQRLGPMHDGPRVFGHQERAHAIIEAWEQAGHVACVGVMGTDQVDVVLIDVLRRKHGLIPREEVCADPYSTVIVSITDTFFPQVESDIIINHSPFFRARDARGNVTRLFGPEYFLAKQVVRYARHRSYDGPPVYIPGGAANKFWDLVGEPPENALIAAGVEKQRLVDWLADAAYVVSAAGVSALEAAYIGKPLLIVKTADDQELNFQGLREWALAQEYSRQRLDAFRNKKHDPVRNFFASNGPEKVVEEILKKAEELCQYGM